MKFRKLALIAIVLVFCATIVGVFFGGGETVNAAITTGTSLFTSSTGSTTVTSTLQAEGIQITFRTSSEESTVLYRHNVDMNLFKVRLRVNSKHFDSFFVLLTDPEDSDNNIVVEFAPGETSSTVKVTLSDALDTELQTTNTVETVIGTTENPVEIDDRLELVYTANPSEYTGEFKVVVLRDTGVDTEYSLATRLERESEVVSFDWLHGTENQVVAPLMEATMKIGVKGQETTDNVPENSAPINSSLFVQSITNIMGEQGLTKDDTVVVPPLVKFNHLEYRGKLLNCTDKAPVTVAPETEEGDENEIVTYDNCLSEAELEELFAKIDGEYFYETIGAKGASYKFPFYAVSILGKGFDKITWSLTVGDEEPTEEEVISSQTSKSLDAEIDSVYQFYFEVAQPKSGNTGDATEGDPTTPDGGTTDDVTFHFFLKVRVVKDELDPEINNEELKRFVYSKIESMTINAPATGSFEFPVVNTLLNISEGNLFTDKITDNEDNSFDNLTIVVGYKRPNSTSNWTYASSTKVTFNSVGTWAFVYKVTDQSGNDTLSDIFLFDIQDVTPPTIKTSNKDVTAGEILTVPTPTRSDNCVGINTDKSDYRIWVWNADTETKGAEITKTVKDKKFTPKTIGEKYIVEYEAEDRVGNRSEIVTSILTVVEPKAVTPDPNPVNDVLIIILIVVGTLVVVTLAIYLFMGRKEEKFDAREGLIPNETDDASDSKE